MYLTNPGNFLAYTAVSNIIKENCAKEYTHIKFKKEIQNWYKQLFTPKVQSGLAAASVNGEIEVFVEFVINELNQSAKLVVGSVI